MSSACGICWASPAVKHPHFCFISCKMMSLPLLYGTQWCKHPHATRWWSHSAHLLTTVYPSKRIFGNISPFLQCYLHGQVTRGVYPSGNTMNHMTEICKSSGYSPLLFFPDTICLPVCLTVMDCKKVRKLYSSTVYRTVLKHTSPSLPPRSLIFLNGSICISPGTALGGICLTAPISFWDMLNCRNAMHWRGSWLTWVWSRQHKSNEIDGELNDVNGKPYSTLIRHVQERRIIFWAPSWSIFVYSTITLKRDHNITNKAFEQVLPTSRYRRDLQMPHRIEASCT